MISKIMMSSVVLATALAASFPTILQAQDVSPPTQKTSLSIADILKNSSNDQQVVIRGVMLKKMAAERYMLTDGTGEIKAKIADAILPAQAIGDKTQVVIRGEVEKDPLQAPEIHVKAISLAP